MSEQDNKTPPSGEDADLLRIHQEAIAMESKAAPAQQGEQNVEIVPADMQMLVDANAELLELGWEMVGDLLPSDIAECYTLDKRKKIAKAYTVVALKRGWDVGELLEKWGPEIALGMAVMGPCAKVLVVRFKAARAKKGGANVGHQ